MTSRIHLTAVELIELSGDVYYEVGMLQYLGGQFGWESETAVEACKYRYPRPNDRITSALIESWVIHVRNLCEFFVLDRTDDKVAHASDWMPSGVSWSSGNSDHLKRVYGRANVEVSHIGKRRIRNDKFSKRWCFCGVTNGIDRLAKAFFTKADHSLLHPHWIRSPLWR